MSSNRLTCTAQHTHHSSLRIRLRASGAVSACGDKNGLLPARPARRLTRLTTLRYDIALRWQGSTGAGWDAYDRTHVATASPAEQEVRLTTGESKGDPAILNPEQLLVMAASSCQMLWFLHLAAKARIDVVAYADDAAATMPPDAGLDEIRLRPRVTLTNAADEARAVKLLHKAHDHCNIARSLRTPIALEPHMEVRT